MFKLFFFIVEKRSYILGLLQRISGIWENYLHGNYCGKYLSIPGLEKKQQQNKRDLRVWREKDVDILVCLREVANAWVKIRMLEDASDSNIDNPLCTGLLGF